MHVGLRVLKPQVVKWLRRELRRGELCWAALGQGLCEQDGRRNPCNLFGGKLEELGAIRLRTADSRAARQLRAGLLEAAHPLGRAPGCRLTYPQEARAGPVGVLSFVAAPLRLGPLATNISAGMPARAGRIFGKSCRMIGSCCCREYGWSRRYC